MMMKKFTEVKVWREDASLNTAWALRWCWISAHGIKNSLDVCLWCDCVQAECLVLLLNTKCKYNYSSCVNSASPSLSPLPRECQQEIWWAFRFRSGTPLGTRTKPSSSASLELFFGFETWDLFRSTFLAAPVWATVAKAEIVSQNRHDDDVAI